LTIDAARKLLAKPKSSTTTTPTAETTAAAPAEEEEPSVDGKPTPEAMIAKQTANAEEETSALNDVDIDGERQERVNWIFAMLMQKYPQDELLDLTERLAKHLGMTLMPLSKSEALMKILSDAPQTAPVA
jgi:hypothetical protein